MFSISLDNCEVKENVETAMNLIGEINEVVASLDSGSCRSLDEAEERILEGTKQGKTCGCVPATNIYERHILSVPILLFPVFQVLKVLFDFVLILVIQ